MGIFLPVCEFFNLSNALQSDYSSRVMVNAEYVIVLRPWQIARQT